MTVAEIHAAGFDAVICTRCQHTGLKPHGFESDPALRKCSAPDPSTFHRTCGHPLDVVKRRTRGDL
jgi:hypothetical protein